MTRIMEISRLSGYVIECNGEESERDEASARESDINRQWEKKVREKDTERAFIPPLFDGRCKVREGSRRFWLPFARCG